MRFVEEDETAALLEDACTPIDQVLHKLTNGEITQPIKPIKSTKYHLSLHLIQHPMSYSDCL